MWPFSNNCSLQASANVSESPWTSVGACKNTQCNFVQYLQATRYTYNISNHRLIETLQEKVRTCNKNSALLHASSGESIFVGFNSQLCLLSINFTIVSRRAAFKNEVQTDFMYKSIKVVVRLAALNNVGVSSSFST